MDRLAVLSQDKHTMADLREYFRLTLEKEIISNTLSGKDTTGYAEANKIIKSALDGISKLSNKKSEKKNINQSE